MKRWIHASNEATDIVDTDLEYVCNRDGYQCYRKIVDGKGKWFAHHQDSPIETMFPITYDQALGWEDMPDESSIRKLQRKLSEKLLSY